MIDQTEDIRRVLIELVNEGVIAPDDPTWTTDQLVESFDVMGFMAPFVVVRRKSDGAKGTLMFRHQPRIYFGWTAYEE